LQYGTDPVQDLYPVTNSGHEMKILADPVASCPAF